MTSCSTPYKRCNFDSDYDAIVIGSGLGGLATAALLAKHAGKKVLVLEQHYTAGGFTHTFKRPGFEWDVGVHYIGDVHRPRSMMRRMFDHLSDGQLEWADMGPVYDTIILGDERFELPRGTEAYKTMMKAAFPGEARAIDEYVALVQRTVKWGQGYFAEKVLPAPISKVVGGALRYPTLRLARKTTRQVLSKLTSNERLIGVLTGQWGDYGLTPNESSFYIHAMVAGHYLEGAAYPVGGSGRIAETIVPLIERAGGLVVTSAEVESILVRYNRAFGVRMADGREIFASEIISDAGVSLTYRRLLPAEVAADNGLDRRVEEIPASVAHLSLYVGLDKTAEELDLQKSNLWVYPNHEHDRNVARFREDPSSPLPVSYLSFPSAKDPDFQNRYPGKATVEALTLAPYEWFARWEDTRWHKRGESYDNFKQGFHDRLMAALVGQCPQIAAHVAHAELSSPLSTAHFCAHPRGEIYGLAHTPPRFEARWLRPQTPVKGLHLTGADICSAGIGGALFGGVLTSSALLKRNLISTIMTQTKRSSSAAATPSNHPARVEAKAAPAQASQPSSSV